MVYMVCPTCGTLIAHYQTKYEIEKEKIINNRSISIKEKEQELSNVLKSFKLRRECCKTRLITYIDPIDILIK